MADPLPTFTSVAPGRLCLFGEHQDYLDLPVIALALPLRCRIDVTPEVQSRVIELRTILDDDTRQVTKIWSCDLNNLPTSPAYDPRTGQPDFSLACVVEVCRAGYTLPVGAKCVSSTGALPVQKGCSSSSAFCVAWVQALVHLANTTKRCGDDSQPTLSPLELAKLAHAAEVTHFGAPGGTMDHITSSVGGLVRIGNGPAGGSTSRMWHVDELPGRHAGVWVLADSGEPKDTVRHLARCKGDRLRLLYDKLEGSWDSHAVGLGPDEYELLRATRTNRDTERAAYDIWKRRSSLPDTGPVLGALMLRHHEALRDGLKLSTERLEAMRKAALEAGAWGFKLVGSGGGGCGVAWTSIDKAEAVATAMTQAGAIETWVVSRPSTGAHILTNES